MPTDLSAWADLNSQFWDRLYTPGSSKPNMHRLLWGEPITSHYTRSHVRLRVNPEWPQMLLNTTGCQSPEEAGCGVRLNGWSGGVALTFPGTPPARGRWPLR